MLHIEPLAIPDVKLIRPRRFDDERGYFQQTWHQQQYREAGLDINFVQDNLSFSEKGSVRGLHYQLKNAQAKLVSVLSGRVFDVAVDLRKSSQTFGQWVGAELSDENGCQLFIPRGFAHGFAVLSETALFHYKCDNFYAPGDEYALHWQSPSLQIDWQLEVEPRLSAKDASAPDFATIDDSLLFS